MNVAVIGTGYVGLVTGTVLADIGNHVICVDNNAEKINGLNKGRIPIYEPGLEEMVVHNTAKGRLRFSTDIAAATEFAKIIFIAVGTPPLPSGETDLSFVKSVAETIAPHINSYKVIVNKSTVPVGTGDLVGSIIRQNLNGNKEAKFDVVSNPEFLREGSAIEDTMHPDRIVVGADSPEAAAHLVELYVPLHAPVLITTLRSAEVIKYASNSFLALKISYANMIASFCELVGADIKQVTENMGLDKRIAPAFLNAGIGYGGSCFPKDVASLIHVGDKLGYSMDILKAATSLNEAQPLRFAKRMEERIGSFQGKEIAVLGLAFKPNTDDMREAPSIPIITTLINKGAKVRAYDPIAVERAKEVLPAGIKYCETIEEVTTGADAIALLTEWNEFKLLDLEELRNRMRGHYFFDGRNLYDPKQMGKLGFDYLSVGRA